MSIRTVLLALALSLAACGDDPAEIGGECDDAGQIDQCVEGAICSNVGDGNTCRKICTDQAQCSATENCNGVSNSSTKSCQPK